LTKKKLPTWQPFRPPLCPPSITTLSTSDHPLDHGRLSHQPPFITTLTTINHHLDFHKPSLQPSPTTAWPLQPLPIITLTFVRHYPSQSLSNHQQLQLSDHRNPPLLPLLLLPPLATISTIDHHSNKCLMSANTTTIVKITTN